MNLTTIRNGLKTRLATITAFSQTFAHPPNSIIPPAAFVGTARLNPRATLGNQGDVEFDLWVAVSSAADSESNRVVIDDYMSTEGTKSVDAAIQASSTLGGVVDSAVVTAIEGPIELVLGGVSYDGIRFTVQVYE